MSETKIWVTCMTFCFFVGLFGFTPVIFFALACMIIALVAVLVLWGVLVLLMKWISKDL